MLPYDYRKKNRMAFELMELSFIRASRDDGGYMSVQAAVNTVLPGATDVSKPHMIHMTMNNILKVGY